MKKEDYTAILEKIRKFHQYNPLFSGYKVRFCEETVLEEIEAFIRTLNIDPEKARPSAERIGRFFIEHSLPFSILIEDLEIIKNYLVCREISTEKESEQIIDFFKSLENWAGYFFIEHDAKEYEKVECGCFGDKLLYTIHDKWWHWLIDSIIHRNVEEFPLTDADSCPLVFALDYPESKMICHELNICGLLKKTHAKLHELTITFGYLYMREYYKSAYIVFQQIREINEKLLNLIGILYFNAQIDRPRTFKNFLHAQMSQGKELFVAILDIAGMKKINKHYAPKIGDKVIETVAGSLDLVYLENQSCMVYTKGTGGDFYLLFENCFLESIRKIEEEIDETLEKRVSSSPILPKFVLQKAFLKIDGPIPLEKDETSAIFNYLKECLKGDGKSLYLTSDRERKRMMTWIRGHYTHIANIKKMLDEGAVEIFLQPISHMERIDKVYAYEVLARIEENGKVVPAAAFIDLIVEMGMIARLDHLILDRILHYKERIHQTTGKLFINVSASTLMDESYVDRLIRAIRGPLMGTEIIVELTEQVLLENLGLIVKMYREHGIIFAIDDFGTGYSSLQSVIDLAEEGAIRYLKIDGSLTQSFEKSSSTRRIIRIISEMSRSLELETIIEFVETEKQRYELEACHIDYAQGYYIGKPLHILEITKK